MRTLNLLFVVSLAAPASAQSLLRDVQPLSTSQASPVAASAPSGEPAGPTLEQTQAPLKEASLFFVEAPKPKGFNKNDLVTILIDEQTTQASDADSKTEKKLDFNGALEHFINLTQFYQLRLEPSPRDPIAQVDLNAKNKWEGKSNYDRADKLSAKITATIIDIKPNGVLVLEAKKTVTKDAEVTTVVLTGNVRTADVTTSNTVLSSQIADMIISLKNEGEVRDATKKGWIPRLFDTVFAL